MLFRGFGAMNGCRGGAGTPPIGDDEAIDPSNGLAADPFGSPTIGTTGTPGTWAAAVAAQTNGAASSAAAIKALAPQPLWRIVRRAYGRLRAEWIRSRSSSSWPATS